MTQYRAAAAKVLHPGGLLRADPGVTPGLPDRAGTPAANGRTVGELPRTPSEGRAVQESKRFGMNRFFESFRVFLLAFATKSP